MKGLRSLIRLHKWRVDEARRKLAALEGLAEDVRQRIAKLDAESEVEIGVATASFESRRFFDGFARVVLERRARLTQTLAELNAEIDLAREEAGAAFRELKKYELVQAREVAEERTALGRLQQRQLDEMGIDRFRRNAAG
ncbi:MAG: flagellar FliJ family protein [Alphaproteobacteria bacterium]